MLALLKEKYSFLIKNINVTWANETIKEEIIQIELDVLGITGCGWFWIGYIKR